MVVFIDVVFDYVVVMVEFLYVYVVCCVVCCYWWLLELVCDVKF